MKQSTYDFYYYLSQAFMAFEILDQCTGIIVQETHSLQKQDKKSIQLIA